MKALALLVMLAACGDETSPPRAPLVYVSLPAEGAVARIDVATWRVAGKTIVGALPHDLVQVGDRIYVALVGSQAIAELDAATGALLRTLRTEPVPHARADGTPIVEHDARAFASTTCFACHHPGDDGARPVVVGARPFGLVASADGATLFVAGHDSGDLSAISLATGEARVVPLAPRGAAHQPTGLARLGDDLYVTILPALPSVEPGVLRRLDGATLRALGEAAIGPSSGTIVADAARGRLYVSDSASDTVTRYDATPRAIDRVTVPSGPLGLLLDGARLWIAGYYGGALAAIDLDLPPAAAAPAPPIVNPTHLALAPDRRALWVVSSGTAGSFVELDPATRTATRTLPLGALPFDVIAVPPNHEE